eukprot:Seg1197.4 transcript_id=Seg1197.4/GoldUCD/mRNA.D3Y31 product="hypothetical protein" protein_id=Seg1197.4/GoldUCD/D3Y31
MDEYTQRHFQQYLRSKMEEERRLGATVQGQGVIEKDSEKDELTQPSSASNTKQGKTAPKKKQNTNEKASKFEWPDNLVESLINALARSTSAL